MNTITPGSFITVSERVSALIGRTRTPDVPVPWGGNGSCGLDAVIGAKPAA
jgi:hypothetical protein